MGTTDGLNGRIRFFTWVKVLLVAGTVLALAACSGRGTDDGLSEQPEAIEYREGMIGEDPGGDPVTGGTFTFAAWAEPASLDPAVTLAAASTGGNELLALYDSLLRYDPETQEFVPQLAENLTQEDDTTWTLTLRDGVTFSDGTPLTAETVKASQERYAEIGGPESALWKINVSSIDAVDDHTVVYQLNQPWPLFPSLLSTGPGMIVAPGVGEGENFTPIGAGPFVLDHWSPSEELVLARNDNYWDGPAHLDAFRVVFVGDQIARVQAEESGSVDAVLLRSPDLVAKAWLDGHRGYNNMVAVSDMAMINASEGRPGSDVRVRQALALSVDPQTIKDRVYDGYGLTDTEMFPEYSRWHTDVAGPAYDPEEARRLLEEAKADGYDGKIVYVDNTNQERRETAMALKASWEAVGFEVELDFSRNVGDQISRIIGLDYDVTAWGLSFREADPYAKMFATMHSTGAQTYGMYTSDEMDALLAEFQAAADDDQRRDVMGRIQQRVTEDMPYLNFGPLAEFTYWDDSVHGIQGTSNSMLLLHDAWVE